jgi:predicted dehydrogenase
VTDRRRTPIGVGIVGTGFAARAHLDALARLPGVRAVAVAGHDPARVEELAGTWGLRGFSDWADLIAADEVEAVHDCSVNRMHFEVNLAALVAGKHVLSEKPLAISSEQSAVLASAAAEAAAEGVLSGVCFNYRHYPMAVQIREMLASGEFGRPHFIRGQYLQDWLLLESDWNWRVEAGEAGDSRAVADIGTHWADLAQYVLGDPIAEVLADLTTLHRKRERPGPDGPEKVAVAGEDFGSVLLRFRSGAHGAMTFAQTSAGRKNGLSLQIDTGGAGFEWEQERPDRVWVGRREGPNLEMLRDPDSLLPRAAALARLPAGHPEGWNDALRNLCAEFYAAIGDRRDGAPVTSEVATFADGHALVCFVEAVLASDRDGRWTAVPVAEKVVG